MPQITMEYSEFQAVVSKREEAERQVVDLERQLTELRVKNADGQSIADMLRLTRSLMRVLQFAVGNLPPESAIWDTKLLREIAEQLKVLPDYSTFDQELGIDLTSFATEADRVNLVRTERRMAPLDGNAEA